ncbi:MAG TPA: hypothetical protein VGQ30_10865 [Gemmatimonadaceae bacterium]|jgi:hypothetical protein|nr:hypothetical protein [Gemmatimonadaceae bacterium]
MLRTRALALGVSLVGMSLLTAPVQAQSSPPRQTEGDAYTRYELLAPGSAKFRIIYEVTATTAGATYYFNPIRKGSVATDESVSDRATGKPLVFDVVGQDVATAGGVRGTDTSQKYIRVKLSHPVPENGGEARVLILKTYEDAASYFTTGDVITFTRGLGIKRNTIVLPPGYEMTSCNYPSQVIQQDDGRVAISFWNGTPGEAPLTLKARPAQGLGKTKTGIAGAAARLDERAHQNRKIVYFLQQPETHAFDLYHDYTESKPGTSTYINEVRAGSTVSKPSARNLDTGEELKWEVLKGDAITRANLGVKDVTPASEIVVFRFAPVQNGASTRIRMFETYTDTARYKLVGDELMWDRSFGRPANAVVLPAGWMLTNSSVPATVSEQPDGRIRVDFINPRTDEIPVLLTARRRRN